MVEWRGEGERGWVEWEGEEEERRCLFDLIN